MASSPLPAAALRGSGCWHQWGVGAGKDSQATQTGSSFCTFLCLNSLESHLLSTPFEADVLFGLGPLVSLPMVRSIQTAARLGWGPGHGRPAPGPVLQVDSRGSPSPGPRGGPAWARKGALTVRRQRRVPWRASVGASPLSGKPGPGQPGQCKLGTGGREEDMSVRGRRGLLPPPAHSGP